MKALITGVTGQDGSYLSELLLEKEYKVVGLARRCSHSNVERISHILDHKNFELVEGDVTDLSSVYGIIQKYKPDRIFNTAAQSHVGTSFSQPLYTWNVVAVGCMNILEAVCMLNYETRILQLSSSEQFGDQYTEILDPEFDKFIKLYGNNNVAFTCSDSKIIRCQNEHTKMNPQSPYAIAKLAAYNAARLYRNSYGMFVSNSITFNHESPRRGSQFVTQKICKWIGNFLLWSNSLERYKNIEEEFPKLRLGNLYAQRDWGFARDHCSCMIKILEHDKPDDFVIGTEETHTVEEFLIEAFKCINISDYKQYVVIDESLKRPSEVPYLRADASKARKVLGWEPKVSFKQLVKMMVDYEIQQKA